VSKLFIPKIEFYITNVCNLACNECNRFNNLKFTGTQLWKDYEAVYEEWAEYIEFDRIVILGGEPLLNPSIVDWIKGLHRLWPKYGKQILTNATQLDKVKGLYEACRDNMTWIGISLHHLNELEFIEERIENYLGNISKREYDQNGCGRFGSHWYYENNEGVGVGVWHQDYFWKNSILDSGTPMKLHNNNPTQVHEFCTFVKNKNYHFIRGNIYKCGPVALFPELIEQFDFDLSTEDRELVQNYQPLTLEMVKNGEGQAFLDHIDNEIPQCKFCPEHYTGQSIDVDTLKQKIRKH